MELYDELRQQGHRERRLFLLFFHERLESIEKITLGLTKPWTDLIVGPVWIDRVAVSEVHLATSCNVLAKVLIEVPEKSRSMDSESEFSHLMKY